MGYSWSSLWNALAPEQQEYAHGMDAMYAPEAYRQDQQQSQSQSQNMPGEGMTNNESTGFGGMYNATGGNKGSSSGWGGISDAVGKGVGAAGSMGVAALADQIFPGKGAHAQMVDRRTDEMRKGAGQADQRLTNLLNNPNSFGLPGDPNDPNTPAGQRGVELKRARRSADAARGQLDTGGSAVREMEDLNRAIASEYNTSVNQGFQNVASMNPSQYVREVPAQPNPWAKLITAAAGPVAEAGAKMGAKKVWSSI